MKLSILSLFISLCFSLSLTAQDEGAKKNKDIQFDSMFKTEISLESPGEAFTKIYGQEGYEEAASESKIVAMFIPVEYQNILQDFKEAKDSDEKVTGSGEIPYGETTGYYNEIAIPSPENSEYEAFVGIIAILPVEGSTINVSGVCPKSKAEEYVPLYLKVMETVSVKE